MGYTEDVSGGNVVVELPSEQSSTTSKQQSMCNVQRKSQKQAVSLVPGWYCVPPQLPLHDCVPSNTKEVVDASDLVVVCADLPDVVRAVGVVVVEVPLHCL